MIEERRDEPAPVRVRGPLVRWWNTVPLPIRTVVGVLWKNRTIRWIVVILLVVFFGSLVANLLGLTNTLLKPVVSMIQVVIESAAGRLVVLNVALVLTVLWAYRKFRAEARHLIAARAVDRYLAGLENMVHRRFALARRDLQSVLDTARLVDLHTAVAGFPELLEDATLKLAFCQAELGDIPAGMRCLESIPRAQLPPRLARTFDEVHALLYDRSPDFLPETKASELARALAEDPKNVRLLAALVARQEEMDHLEDAVATQKKLLGALGKKAGAAERRHLAWLHTRRARQLVGWENGSEPEAEVDPAVRRRAVAELNRAIKVFPQLSLPYLLLGRLHASAGNDELALATWGRHPSPPALDLVRKLFEKSQKAPREFYRDVVTAFPTAGALMAIAQDAYGRGDESMAERILVRLAQEGITSPGQELLHGDVVARERPEEAEAHYRAGVEAFLASP